MSSLVVYFLFNSLYSRIGYIFLHLCPTHKLCFLSCRPFVVNATFSTCLVGCWSFFCVLAWAVDSWSLNHWLFQLLGFEISNQATKEISKPNNWNNTFKYHVFAPMGRFQLELIYLYFPPSSHQTVVVSVLYRNNNCLMERRWLHYLPILIFKI